MKINFSIIAAVLVHLSFIQFARANEQLLTPVGPAESYVDWAERPSLGDGVAFGLENGLWGQAYAQGIRVKIPFHRHWNVTLRPLILHQVGSDVDYRADVGGRLSLIDDVA